jgi:hypothetical protein
VLELCKTSRDAPTGQAFCPLGQSLRLRVAGFRICAVAFPVTKRRALVKAAEWPFGRTSPMSLSAYRITLGVAQVSERLAVAGTRDPPCAAVWRSGSISANNLTMCRAKRNQPSKTRKRALEMFNENLDCAPEWCSNPGGRNQGGRPSQCTA